MNDNCSGSGFDSYFKDTIVFKNGNFIIENSFHCMNEDGYYEGYQDFKLQFDPNNILDFKLQFKGDRYLANKHMLREYIEDTIHTVLIDYLNNNNV